MNETYFPALNFAMNAPIMLRHISCEMVGTGWQSCLWNGTHQVGHTYHYDQPYRQRAGSSYIVRWIIKRIITPVLRRSSATNFLNKHIEATICRLRN
jgi:hypothetical protein